MNKCVVVLMCSLLTVLAGCASSYKPSTYQAGQVQQQMRVKLATVVDIREVDIEMKSTGTGAAVGASAAAVAASNSYYRGGSSVAAGIAGVVIGGLVGAATEKSVNTKKGIEILYRLDGTTDLLALVQEQESDNPIQVGDRIRIIEGSFAARAVKSPS